MARCDEDVKNKPFLTRTRHWIECHPHLGWYLTLFLGANYALDIISIVIHMF